MIVVRKSKQVKSNGLHLSTADVKNDSLKLIAGACKDQGSGRTTLERAEPQSLTAEVIRLLSDSRSAYQAGDALGQVRVAPIALLRHEKRPVSGPHLYKARDALGRAPVRLTPVETAGMFGSVTVPLSQPPAS